MRNIIFALAFFAIACPKAAQPPKPEMGEGQSPSVRPITRTSTANTLPVLLSPDPLRKEIDRLRAAGFTGLIRVRSGVSAVGTVEKCEVVAELAATEKDKICKADSSRQFKTVTAFEFEETFVPPSLR
jgi:hypothetical protein